MVFRFLHISDLHLGRGGEFCKKLHGYTKKVFENAVSKVKELNLDALIIAGDLFEEDSLEDEDIRFIFDCLRACEKPVFISPGNHDFYPNSFYNPQVLSLRELESWPENVIIFKESEFTPYHLSGVVIYGKANFSLKDKAFAEIPSLDPSLINIAVFHGSRLADIPEDKDLWLPFTDEELIKSGFDYVCLGHYHERNEIRDREGNIRGAYPGSPIARAIKETGERGGLIVEVRKENNKAQVFTQFIPLTNFCIKKEALIINPGEDIDFLEKKLQEKIKNTKNKEDTFFLFEVEGMGEIEFESLKDKFKDKCFGIEFNTEKFIPYYKDEINLRTVKGLFIQRMEELISKATSDEKKEKYKKALYYGLMAFRGKKVKPLDEEI